MVRKLGKCFPSNAKKGQFPVSVPVSQWFEYRSPKKSRPFRFFTSGRRRCHYQIFEISVKNYRGPTCGRTNIGSNCSKYLQRVNIEQYFSKIFGQLRIDLICAGLPVSVLVYRWSGYRPRYRFPLAVIKKFRPFLLGIQRFKLPSRYIAFNAISCGTLDVVYAATHPEALFPAPILVAGGIFKDAIAPDFVARSGTVAMATALGGVVGSIMAMVVFRYLQRT